MKKLFPAIVVTFLFLTGCQWGNNDMNRDEGQTPVEDTRTTRDGRTTNNDFTQNVENRNRFSMDDSDRSSRNRTDRFDVSDEAAKRIVSEVDEIHQAYVLTTKNNAYVAATLSENSTSQRDRSMNDNRNLSRNDKTRMNERNTGDRATNERRADRNTTNRNKNERNTTTDRNMNDRRDTVTDVRNREFDGDELTDEVKKQVADIVKDVDRNIDNVYVTTSPDFFNLTNDYVDDFQNGRPVEGFFDQIGNMIERVFPQNKR